MGGIFRSPKPAPPPDPKIDETLSRREKAAERERGKELRRSAASRRARRGGGSVLMDTSRQSGPQGGNTQSTLGPSVRNPRG